MTGLILNLILTVGAISLVFFLVRLWYHLIEPVIFPSPSKEDKEIDKTDCEEKDKKEVVSNAICEEKSEIKETKIESPKPKIIKSNTELLEELKEQIREANKNCDKCPSCNETRDIKHSSDFIGSTKGEIIAYNIYECNKCHHIWHSEIYSPDEYFSSREVETISNKLISDELLNKKVKVKPRKVNK